MPSRIFLSRAWPLLAVLPLLFIAPSALAQRVSARDQQAVEALSEPRILHARERLTSIWSWIERGSAMIAQIVQDSALDRELHRVAQQIGRAQSRLLRMTTVFQRVLNDIDRQRVHLGATGLSTSDLVFFLRQCTLDDLERLIAPHLARPVRPLFLLTDLITDQAEYELLQRKRHVAEWCELRYGHAKGRIEMPSSISDERERRTIASAFRLSL